MKLYWTKYIYEFDKETNTYTNTGELIPIQESIDFIPDGDAIGVDMNGISYSKYKKHPDDYTLIDFKLVKKESI